MKNEKRTNARWQGTKKRHRTTTFLISHFSFLICIACTGTGGVVGTAQTGERDLAADTDISVFPQLGLPVGLTPQRY